MLTVILPAYAQRAYADPSTGVEIRDAADPSPLALGPLDVRIEQTLEGGYHLYVRAREGIGSILITESTEAPDHSVATYALRNPVYHMENGDEKRMLDGAFLETDGIYSLIDSTPLPDERFGRAFRIFIPYVVTYGYPWTRHGELEVVDGTYLSVRTFANPYADYSAGYRDNPFILRAVQHPRLTESSRHMPEAVEQFTRIARENRGVARAADTMADALAEMERLLSGAPGRSLDLVVAIDTTESMRDDLDYLRGEFVPMVERIVRERTSARVGMVFYRDYLEEYLTRRVEFQTDPAELARTVGSIPVAGGRDIPEAVHEALYTAVTRFSWAADDRLVILVGDAPPHPRPRGAVTAEMVAREAESRGVGIHTIILPH